MNLIIWEKNWALDPRFSLLQRDLLGSKYSAKKHMLFLDWLFPKVMRIISRLHKSDKIKTCECFGAGVYAEAGDGTPWWSHYRGTIIFNLLY